MLQMSDRERAMIVAVQSQGGVLVGDTAPAAPAAPAAPRIATKGSRNAHNNIKIAFTSNTLFNRVDCNIQRDGRMFFKRASANATTDAAVAKGMLADVAKVYPKARIAVYGAQQDKYSRGMRVVTMFFYTPEGDMAYQHNPVNDRKTDNFIQ